MIRKKDQNFSHTTPCECPLAGFCPRHQHHRTQDEHRNCATNWAYWTRWESKSKRFSVPGPVPQNSSELVPDPEPASKYPIVNAYTYNQPAGVTAPVVTPQGEPTGLSSRFAGSPCFLVCGGPSINSQDLSLLQSRGILIAAVNNIAATHVRPQFWITVDQPYYAKDIGGTHWRFHESILRDGAILKFIKLKYTDSGMSLKPRYRKPGSIADSGKYPGVFGYHHTDGWSPHMLDEPCPTWGVGNSRQDPEGKCKRTSVMLPAIWLLYWLGIREIYLLGADFHQDEAKPYAFDENCDKDRAHSNNDLFKWLNRRFIELTPHFKARNLSIVNCTPKSKLTAFPSLAYPQAIERCRIAPAQSVRGSYQ